MNQKPDCALDRRQFLMQAGSVVTSFAIPGLSGLLRAYDAETSIVLPPLPYAQAALAPSISENTISFHYGKHHQGYVNNAVKLVAGTEYEKMPLEEIVRKTAGKPDLAGIFNNTAQVFNHTFYWKSMKPGGGGKPSGRIGEAIVQSFGGYQKFVEAFSTAATTQFASGWAWLVLDSSKLRVIKTPNAETPLTMSLRPLITIDVWEHAYYLDYQNRRPDYVKAFVDNLLNWDFAEQNMA
ncbi:MAG: superoxide dismutase [Acidobacteria bacterium]|nr:superoxide dismutase [Acidobacteriota bacterium]